LPEAVVDVVDVVRTSRDAQVEIERQEEEHQAAEHAENAVVSRGSWCWKGPCAAMGCSTAHNLPEGRRSEKAHT
jgi:hypothetical protein